MKNTREDELATTIKVVSQLDYNAAYGKDPEACRAAKVVLTVLRAELQAIVDERTRKLTEEEREALFAKSIAELYEFAGVGDTFKHKLAFWNREYPNCYISHVPEDNEKAAEFQVKVHEMTWLSDKFPQHHTYC